MPSLIPSNLLRKNRESEAGPTWALTDAPPTGLMVVARRPTGVPLALRYTAGAVSYEDD